MKFDPFGRSRLWNAHARGRGLGQAAVEEGPEIITSDMIAGALPNRLSEVPVWIILSRRKLAVRIFGPDMKVSTDTSFMTQSEVLSRSGGVYLFKDWTEQDMAAMAAVANDPTEDELQDLALVDGYFAGTQYAKKLDSYTRPGSMFDPGAKEISFSSYCSDPKYSKNPFFCQPAQKYDKPRTMSLVFMDAWLANSGRYSDYFGIDPNLPWEEVKPVMLRAIAVMDALKDYPFPPPIDIRPQYWYVSTKGDINKFIRQDIIVTRDLARIWITMAIVNNYNAVAAWIVHDLEKEARDDKRMAVIKAIGMGAAFAIITAGLGYALAPVIAPLVSAGVPVTADAVASGIMSGVQQALSADQKKQLADDMDKVGKMFDADAPAFAAEAYKVRDTFSYLGEAMSELTDEQKEAINQARQSPEYGASEVGEQYDVEPSNWPLQKKLMIGGGIAAAGVATILAIGFLKG